MPVSIARRPPTWFARVDVHDLFALALLAALTVIALATYQGYAISNDEAIQHRYGELIIAYYASGLTDQAVFHLDNLYLYGGLFDVAAVLLSHVLPVEPYAIRHVLCAMIGIGGIGAAYATARLVAGPRAGLITALTLALCGAWYGAMFNHTKDIPFAAAMIGATYFIIRATRDLPHPRLRHVVGFGLTLGAALGMRSLGLLLLVHLAVAVLLRLPRPWRNLRDNIVFIARCVLVFAPALAIGYLIMIAAWPWAALAPLNPIRGLVAFGHFNYRIGTLLGGQVYDMGAVPRSYVPIYCLIKLPLIMLLGAALAVGFTLAAPFQRRAPPEGRHRETALVIFTIAFPLLCQVAMRGPAFTGLRHFLFIVPPLAVLAGIGLDALLSALAARRPLIARAASVIVAAWFVWNASILIRLHPYEYLFYNPLVGGLEGAAGRYDTDYWVNIMPQAVDELEAFLDRTAGEHNKDPNQHYTVAVCGERLAFEKERDDGRLVWTDDWLHADFFIAPTHMNCDRALKGKVIVTIARMGAVIGVIKDLRVINKPAVAAAPLMPDNL